MQLNSTDKELSYNLHKTYTKYDFILYKYVDDMEYTKEYNYPICFDFLAGHIDDNRCIKLGVRSVLKITENGVSFQQE